MIPKEKIIQALLEHPTQKDALKSLGISRSALNKRAKTSKEIAKTIKLLAQERELNLEDRVRLSFDVSRKLHTKLTSKAKTQGISLNTLSRKALEQIAND